MKTKRNWHCEFNVCMLCSREHWICVYIFLINYYYYHFGRSRYIPAYWYNSTSHNTIMACNWVFLFILFVEEQFTYRVLMSFHKLQSSNNHVHQHQFCQQQAASKWRVTMQTHSLCYHHVRCQQNRFTTRRVLLKIWWKKKRKQY